MAVYNIEVKQTKKGYLKYLARLILLCFQLERKQKPFGVSARVMKTYTWTITTTAS